MKLTNISLAVLVALGLVACGGSDDNNNQTTDPKPPKEIPGDGGNGGDGGTPPKGDKSALVPSRQAPDLTVAPDAKNIVDSRKRVFIDRGFVENALGYSGSKGDVYDSVVGTDPADVRLKSTYNYLAVGDTVSQSAVAYEQSLNASSKYTDESVGAIYVGEDPTDKDKSHAFVKHNGRYYRVHADPSKNPASVPSGKYTPATPFVGESGTEIDDKEFSQKDVVFVANIADKTIGTSNDLSFELGSLKAKDGSTDVYDVATKDQVSLQKVNVFGEDYDASTAGQNLNFGKLNPMREIQTVEVTGTYKISNNKATGYGIDDKSINKSITVGKIKAYNLPYSIALVTTNIDKDLPVAKNIFNLQVESGEKASNASYQVRGYETPSLPREGRAHYYGKSFNASVVGDVELIADFAADRTGISGTIFNRKDHAGTNLPALSLEKIQLTDPDNHNTNKAGKVTGQSAYADAWSVTIFGPEAEEAAGMLYKGGLNEKEGTIDKAKATVKEVYNTQRKELTNVSNNDSVK